MGRGAQVLPVMGPSGSACMRGGRETNRRISSPTTTRRATPFATSMRWGYELRLPSLAGMSSPWLAARLKPQSAVSNAVYDVFFKLLFDCFQNNTI